MRGRASIRTTPRSIRPRRRGSAISPREGGLAYRHHDGANQLGDEVGVERRCRIRDYTYYAPVNTPEKLNDPDRWQPIPFVDRKGGKFVTPGFLTPHWYRVKPFALDRSDQFRAAAPPNVDSTQLRKETDEIIALNGSLTPEQKAIVEFMRDGPRSTGQSGHWLQFAQIVSRRDTYDLDRDVKLFFAVAQRGLRCVHRLLGDEALLRHLASVDVGALLLRGEEGRRLGGAG